MPFDSLGLNPELVHVVADEGYTEPTPVQRDAIPLILAGRDLLAGAQTGTGKTAAFVLPILQLLHGSRPTEPRVENPHGLLGAEDPRGLPGDPRGLPGDPRGLPRDPRGLPGETRDPRERRAALGPIRCLVLVPTRELALQVEQSVRTYGARRPVRSVAIYGGVNFDRQARALKGGPEIVVATPGRLLDHVNQRTIDLSRVEILVLDEADRMLDMGFIRDIRRILQLLPAKRQNLLFSATFSDDIRALAGGFLDQPATVDVAPRNTAAELVEQVVIHVDRDRKRELLSQLVRSGRIDQALVFTRTKHGANRLAEQLARDGIGSAAIHGNRSQSQRVRALDDFKTGRVAILVATDIAARGIDIDALPHVVNFELPMVAQDYVHRIGRTGRAGIDGQAVSLVCVDEAGLLRDIERLLKHAIPSEVVAGFEPDRSIRAEPIRLRTGLVGVREDRHAANRGGRAPGRPAYGEGRAAYGEGRAGYGEGRSGMPLRHPAAARPFPSPARPNGAGPRPSVGGSRPGADAPRPTFNAPRAGANGPRPSFAGPRPSFAGPRQPFAGPRPGGGGPRPQFGAPRPGPDAPHPQSGGPRRRPNNPHGNAHGRPGTQIGRPGTQIGRPGTQIGRPAPSNRW